MTSCTDQSGTSGKDESAKPRKNKSAAYKVGYGKPPVHTRFRKGQSGNPGGQSARTPTEALMLEEACRTVAVTEGNQTIALPAIQAVLRSQVMLALGGDFHAQQFVVKAIQKLGR